MDGDDGTVFFGVILFFVDCYGFKLSITGMKGWFRCPGLRDASLLVSVLKSTGVVL